jgi:hypothetical protein
MILGSALLLTYDEWMEKKHQLERYEEQVAHTN